MRRDLIGVSLAVAVGSLGYFAYSLSNGATMTTPSAAGSASVNTTDPIARSRPPHSTGPARKAAPRETRDTIAAHVKSAARRHGVSEALVAAVVAVESDHNPRAVSRRGALGLMQLMPSTAAVLGVRDAFDARQNVDAGARHLRNLLNRFNDVPLALAAYNAGPQAVIEYGGVPPYPETRAFVARVLARLERDARPRVMAARATPARQIRVATRLSPDGMRREPEVAIIPAGYVSREDDRMSEVVPPAREMQPVVVPPSPSPNPAPVSRAESP